MAMNRRRPPIGAWFGALITAPILYWAAMMVVSLLQPERRSGILGSAANAFALIFGIGVPITAGALLVAAVPAVWLVRRQQPWASVALVALGAVMGLLTTLVLAPYLRGEQFSIPLPLWAGAALGASSAVAFVLQSRPGR
jgi:hypothetical protein